MPSLMPGVPGAKEVYGICLLRNDASLVIPPDAKRRYGLSDGGWAIGATSHPGEPGFVLMSREGAEGSVFKSRIEELGTPLSVHWDSGRAYVLMRMEGSRIRLTRDIMDAFRIDVGDRLLVIKGARIGMAFVPVEVWRKKLSPRGFEDAVLRMETLPEF